MATEHEDVGPIPRLLAAVAHTGRRFPWLVLAGTAVSCAICLIYTFTHLTYENQRNDLHAKDKAYYQRWQNYVKEFGDDDDMVVVVRGAERGQMIGALEAIAERLRQHPELFDRLFYKVDLASLRNRALLFLSADQIRLIQENLQDLKLLLDPFPLGGLDPLFGLERNADSMAGHEFKQAKYQFRLHVQALRRAEVGALAVDTEIGIGKAR